jgi:hypothetical protein
MRLVGKALCFAPESWNYHPLTAVLGDRRISATTRLEQCWRVCQRRCRQACAIMAMASGMAACPGLSTVDRLRLAGGWCGRLLRDWALTGRWRMGNWWATGGWLTVGDSGANCLVSDDSGVVDWRGAGWPASGGRLGHGQGVGFQPVCL